MRRKGRWRVTSDPKLQGALCLRISAYWCCCMLATLLAIGFGSTFRELFHASGGLASDVVPYSIALVAVTLVVLPCLIIDTLNLSNRFAAPLQRLQRQIQNAADGGAADSVKFRDSDYYQELAIAWNAVSEQISELRQHVDQSRSPETTPCDDGRRVSAPQISDPPRDELLDVRS